MTTNFIVLISGLSGVRAGGVGGGVSAGHRAGREAGEDAGKANHSLSESGLVADNPNIKGRQRAAG